MKIVRKITMIAPLWVGCAIFNFGAMNAQEKFEYQTSDGGWSRTQSQRDNLGFIVSESCILPPLETVTSLLITNFLEHGWTLRSWKSRDELELRRKASK